MRSGRNLCAIVLSFVLVGMLSPVLMPETAFASSTIYIKLDGSIQPSGVNITTTDNRTYTFTGNVNDSIIIQRDDIIVDGAGYLLNGTGSGTAISLTYRTNVTIRNMRIERFDTGILIDHSSLCNITTNTIANNDWHAVELETSSNNTIIGNNITGNDNRGIMNDYSAYNTISSNTIGGNYKGIEVKDSSQYNIIQGNNVIDNDNEGIIVEYSKHNSIIENNVTGNHGTGIAVGQSSNTTLNNNRLEDNLGYGLVVTQSPNCTIIGNEVTGNSLGITIGYMNNTFLRNNIMTNNSWNFALYFINASDFTNDVDTSNTVNGKPIYYWIEKHDQTVPADAGMVILFNCAGVTLQNLHVSDGIRQGAVIAYSTNTTITNSYIDSDEYCIWFWNSSGCQVNNSYLDGFIDIQLDYSSNNTVYNNTLTGGGNWGAIGIMSSSGNTFYHNNFTDNYIDVLVDGVSVNNWDNGYPDGGNYWDGYVDRMGSMARDDYNGPNQTQPGSDDFWDRPYPLNDNNTDRYPIVPEYSSTLTIILLVSAMPLMVAVLKRKRALGQEQ